MSSDFAARLGGQMIAPGSVPFSDITEGGQFVFMRAHILMPEHWLTKVGRGYRGPMSDHVFRTGHRAAVYRVKHA